MQFKRVLFLIAFLILLSTAPHARAFWIWSKSDGQSRESVVPQTAEIQKLTTESSKAMPQNEGLPTEKVAYEGAGILQTTGRFLQDVFRLKPLRKGKEQETKSQLEPFWVWSPSQGQFVAPTVPMDQKTAEELFKNALKLRESREDLDKVIQELRRVVHQYPQSTYAPEAQFLLASIFEEQDRPTRAAAEYQKLIKDFPRSERINEVTERLFRIGTQFLSGGKQKIMGVRVIPLRSKAVDIFRFILEQAPYGPYGDQAQLHLGKAYRKMGNFEEAVKAFETLIANYSTSPLVDEAHYELAEASYELSQNAIRDQRAIQQASTHLKDFIRTHAASSLAERARVLKGQLDEQDAEKNYRIGLYYEKQGFMESATIYYEDIADRYAHTAFGKKAAERLKTISEPVRAMQKGEEAVERRLAEVRSMLEALKREEKKRRLDEQGIGDVVKFQGELEAELATLALTQKRFKEESREKFDLRKKAFQERQKNLRGKFKVFNHRKKLLKENPSPELQEVFQRWEESLRKEQDELAEERKVLRSFGLEFKEARIPWFGWVPFFGAPKEVPPEELVQFKEKRWARLEEEKTKLRERRKTSESELEKLVLELTELEEKEFEAAKALPKFQEVVPNELKQTQETLGEKRSQLDEHVRSFEEAKKEYTSRYGNEFLGALTLRSAVPRASGIEALITSGKNLEQEFENLKIEKASLSEAWLVQKERLNTLVQALEGTQARASGMIQEETLLTAELNPEERARQARLLKKRIKYIEREIRGRLDQIQDWQRENAKRMDELSNLLRPSGRSLSLGERTGKILSPATGAYKLTKAFLFGLPNRDRELLEEAKARVAGQGEPMSPDQLKSIRELEEEIELQSILIQGRANEVRDLGERLSQLQKQAKQIPGFNYQSMLIERFPTTLQYSLTSARELLGAKNEEAVFVERVNHQTQELERLEKTISEINSKIEVLGWTVERAKPQSVPAVPSILPSIPGDAETLPTSSEEKTVSTPDEGRTKFESNLVQMRDELDREGRQYQEQLAAYEKTIREWYQAEAREQIIAAFSPEQKTILDQKNRLISKQVEIQNSLRKLIKKEYMITTSQREFLDRKLAELEKRLGKLRSPSQSLSDVLNNEIRGTVQLRDSLIREIAFLESSLKK